MSGQLVAELSTAERDALARSLTGGIVAAVPPAAGPVVNRDAVARFLTMAVRADFSALATVGFVAGFTDGFGEGAAAWKRDLEALLRLVGVGTMIGLAEFFGRPLVEEEPKGLLPQTRQTLEMLNALRRMGAVIRWLDEVGPTEAVRQLREIVPTAEDIEIMIGRAATSWLTELVHTAPDARAAGRHVGRLVGRVAIELIRAFCEPESFSIGEALEVSYEDETAAQ